MPTPQSQLPRSQFPDQDSQHLPCDFHGSQASAIAERSTVRSDPLDSGTLDEAARREGDSSATLRPPGMGFFIAIPLVQGPPAFAEHALRCLAAVVQAP